jgi:hypothetical protein
MNCSICYEKFFKPENKEDFITKLNNARESENNSEEIYKFFNYLITDKHNTTYKCLTPNCEHIFCLDCYNKILLTDKINSNYEGSDNEEYINDIPSKYSKFRCPYCRNIDWKEYMNTVLNELMSKLLGEEEFIEYLYNKFH